MLSGFFVNHPDKNQLLEELHNNSNRRLHVPELECEEIIKAQEMWKLRVTRIVPKGSKWALLASFHSTLYVADAERNFLKLRKILESSSK